eukprot:g910.t1
MPPDPPTRQRVVEFQTNTRKELTSDNSQADSGSEEIEENQVYPELKKSLRNEESEIASRIGSLLQSSRPPRPQPMPDNILIRRDERISDQASLATLEKSLCLPKYGLGREYWNSRYAKRAEPFDWYLTYPEIRTVLLSFISINQSCDRSEFEILIPGAGTSNFCCDLYKDGFRNIVNVDISPIAAFTMRKHLATFSEVDYSIMDALNLVEVPDNFFHFIVDKALLDTFFCVETNREIQLETYIKEMFRVLAPGGIFFVISHSGPQSRIPVFEHPELSWTCQYLWLPRSVKEEKVGTVTNSRVEQMGENETESKEHLEKRVKQMRENGAEGNEVYYVYICTKRSIY